jgi:hypothetical protein
VYGLWPEAWLRLHTQERDDRARSLAASMHPPRTGAVVTSPVPAVVAPRADLACC